MKPLLEGFIVKTDIERYKHVKILISFLVIKDRNPFQRCSEGGGGEGHPPRAPSSGGGGVPNGLKFTRCVRSNWLNFAHERI